MTRLVLKQAYGFLTRARNEKNPHLGWISARYYLSALKPELAIAALQETSEINSTRPPVFPLDEYTRQFAEKCAHVLQVHKNSLEALMSDLQKHPVFQNHLRQGALAAALLRTGGALERHFGDSGLHAVVLCPAVKKYHKWLCGNPKVSLSRRKRYIKNCVNNRLRQMGITSRYPERALEEIAAVNPGTPIADSIFAEYLSGHRLESWPDDYVLEHAAFDFDDHAQRPQRHEEAVSTVETVAKKHGFPESQAHTLALFLTESNGYSIPGWADLLHAAFLKGRSEKK